MRMFSDLYLNILFTISLNFTFNIFNNDVIRLLVQLFVIKQQLLMLKCIKQLKR
jgi:hypothetical protein